MGLITKYREFKQQRRAKAIARNLKTIGNPKAIREDRLAAIDFFAELGEAATAVPALLKRFDYSLEHGIYDTREKEGTMAAIIAYEQAALPFITEHLASSDRIAWPLKTLKALASDSEVVATLSKVLNFSDVAFDQKKVDKNYDILCYLRDYPLAPELCQRLFHFLDSHDERVRFAAVEVLLEQQERAIPAKLERFLNDTSAENTRIRQAVIEAFLKHRWTIQDKQSFNQGPLAGGVVITRDYQLASQT